MAGLSKSVSFKIVTDAGTAQETLDDLNAQAQKLQEPIELKIGGSTGEAAEQIDAIDQEIAALKEELGLTDEAFAGLATSVGAAAEGLGEATGVTASFGDALKGLGDTAAAVRDIEASLAEADDQLAASARVATNAIAAEARGLKALAAAEDDAKASAEETTAAQEGQASKTEESAGIFEGAAGKIKLAALGVAAGLVYGTVKAVGFQSELETLHTQAGVAQSALSGLGSGVISLAGQVGFSPDSLVEALYHVESSFSSVGITGPAALNLLKTAAEGAAVGHADLTDVVNALDATIASGVPGITSYSAAMGALNAIVGSGDMTMQDLADAMGTGVMAVAKSFGQSIYQVGAALAVFGDNNIRGAKAATELRMAWQAMQAPLTTAGPILKSIGLTMTSLGDTMEHKGLSAAIQEFIQHLEASKVPADQWGQYMTEIFGKKAGVGIGILTDQIGRLQSKFPDLEKGASGFGKAWTAQGQTVSQEWKNLVSGIEALATSQGSVLMPVTQKVLKLLDDFVVDLTKGKAPALAIAAAIGGVLAGVALKKLEDGLSTAAEGFKGLYEGGEAVVGWASSLVSSLTGAGNAARSAAAETDALTAAQDEQKVAAEGAAVAQGELDVAEDANPIGAIIIAIVALVAVIVLLATHWKQVWGDIKNWATDAWHFLDGILHNGIVQDILDVWSLGLIPLVQHWSEIWGSVKSIAEGFWHWLDGVIHSGIVADILDIWSLGLIPLAQHWKQIFNDIKTYWPEIKVVLEAPINDVVGFFEKLPGRIMTAVKDLPGLFKNLGILIIKGLWDGILSLGDWIWGQVENFAQTYIINPFKSVLHMLSPSKVFHGFGQNIVEGLALGITDNAHIATDAIARLGQSVSAALQVSTSGVGVGGAHGGTGNFNVTNNVTVAGIVGDAGATGRAIGQALNAYLRQTGQKQAFAA